MLGFIWNTLLKQPILTVLLWLSSFTGNFGLAIILLTILIQLVLLPFRLPQLKSSHKIRQLKPELDKLKEKHGKDKQALAKAQMELYKKHKVSPLGGLLPTLVSIPIILALYRVLLSTLGGDTGVDTSFLWLDVTKPDPYYILPLIVGGVQFVLSSMTLSATTNKKKDSNNKGTDNKKEKGMEDMAQTMQSQMKFMFPAISAFITATLPAGVGLYWLTSTSFAIIQQKFVMKRYGPKNDSTTTK